MFALNIFVFSEIITAMINWYQDFVSFNSVCNHTSDSQIRLLLRGRPILLITRMSTDRIGLHSPLLSLLIAMQLVNQKKPLFWEVPK